MTVIKHKIDPALVSLVNAIDDKKKLYSALSMDLLDITERNFKNEGRGLAIPWPALKPATIKSRIRKNTWPGKILQERGHLARSIQKISSNEFAGVGTNVVYAKTHFLGLRIFYPSRARTLNFKVDFQTGKSRFATKKKANFQQDAISKAYSIKFPMRNPFQLMNKDYDLFEGTILGVLRLV